MPPEDSEPVAVISPYKCSFCWPPLVVSLEATAKYIAVWFFTTLANLLILRKVISILKTGGKDRVNLRQPGSIAYKKSLCFPKLSSHFGWHRACSVLSHQKTT